MTTNSELTFKACRAIRFGHTTLTAINEFSGSSMQYPLSIAKRKGYIRLAGDEYKLTDKGKVFATLNKRSLSCQKHTT